MEYGIKHIEQSLRRASTIACCNHVIDDLRNGKELSPEMRQWVSQMFNLSLIGKYGAPQIATIIRWMLSKYSDAYDPHDLYHDLYQLSHKIARNRQLTHTDWDLILNGVEQYRHKLLGEIPMPSCVKVW